jgi:predicted enzyme related to lactoylglutathione lyase
MADSYGAFVWYELLTPDKSVAKKFYPSITGWGTQPFGQAGYEMWTSGGTPMGGMMNINEEQKKRGVPPHWCPYIGVAKVDATTAQSQKLGGTTVVPPTDIPEVGRFAILKDPQGAVYGIVSSEGTSNPPSENPNFDPQVGQVSWHELMTTDHPAALDYYTKLYGWEKQSEFDMGKEMGMYEMFGKNGQMYGGMFNKTAEMKFPPNWLCYVRVNDLNAAIEAVKKGGGQIMNGPMEVPGGDVIAQCSDPQGAFFALHEKKS